MNQHERNAEARAALIVPNAPLYRWSNGYSAAIEFTAKTLDEFTARLSDALGEYRFQYGTHCRLELHVRAGDLWLNPCFPNPTGGIEIFGQPAMTATFVHVINIDNRAADPTPVPIVRGTDYVLVIGPDNWHATELYSACECSRLNQRRMNSFFAGVGETVEALMENPTTQ